MRPMGLLLSRNAPANPFASRELESSAAYRRKVRSSRTLLGAARLPQILRTRSTVVPRSSSIGERLAAAFLRKADNPTPPFAGGSTREPPVQREVTPRRTPP